MSDHGSDSDSHYGPNENMDEINDMHMNVIATIWAIQLLPTIGRVMFHVTETMLHLLQMRMSKGLDNEDPHEHLQISMDPCGSFVFKNMPQDFIGWLIPLFLTRKTLAELHNDSFTF